MGNARLAIRPRRLLTGRSAYDTRVSESSREITLTSARTQVVARPRVVLALRDKQIAQLSCGGLHNRKTYKSTDIQKYSKTPKVTLKY